MDVADAWEIVRRARDAVLDDVWHPVPELAIHPGGEWRAGQPLPNDVAALFDTLLPIACGPRCSTLAQLGQSLDGRIATVTGESRYVTGEASRVHLHRLRALVDAVVVGVGTVVADDPELTVRHVAGDSPVRVVLDPHARVPRQCKLFRGHGPPVWHAIGRDGVAAPHTRPLRLRATTPAAVARELRDQLAAAGLERVLIEGGAATVSSFLAAGCVDRMHLVVAPILLGAGRAALQMAGIQRLADALRPHCRSFALGEDRLYDLDFRVAHVDARNAARVRTSCAGDG